MTLYKILDHDGAARQGKGSWHLPKGKRPGKWMPPIKGDLVPCENGYHLARETDLLEWLGPAIYEVEYRGEMIEDTDKIVAREARLIRKCGGWNEATARLFAADCAERVLSIFEKECPNDDRPRKAVEASRAYARGGMDEAARSAARSAAWSAAWSAAGSATWSAAWSAARSAAGSAAWSAAGSAARSAAGSAAWSAAGSAAGSAARSAEQEWQRKRLLEYLTGNAAKAKAA